MGTLLVLFSLVLPASLLGQTAPATNYDRAGGSADPLGFVVWSDQPGFVAPGQTATIQDGNGVELVSQAGSYTGNNGIDLASATFYLTMQRGSTLLAQHVFRMESFAGNNIWLIGDPGLTEPNGSFTPAFLEAMMDLGSGNHQLTVRLYIEHGGSLTALNEGSLVYDGRSGTSAHEAVLANLRDASRAWQQNVQETTREFEEAYEAERAAEEAARNFSVSVRNRNSGRTRYIVILNRRTLSEEIVGVQPGSTRTIRLSRAGSYELLVYDQDQTNDDAVRFAQVDESDEGASFSVQ
jgi:hypothetical protein